MPARTYVVRFPTVTEHWFGDYPHAVGDEIVRRGVRYVVTSVDEEDDNVVVTLGELGDPSPARDRPPPGEGLEQPTGS